MDLDSVAFQEKDLGGRIRAVLKKRLGVATIPQVFVGGVHLGGATDLFEAWEDGRLPAMLEARGYTVTRLE